MACCDCCCPNPEECCKSQGENGICCLPEKCCGTAEAPECCSPSEFCCEEVCCPEGYVCCEGVCCDEGQCCVGGECVPCCESDEDCPEGQCCYDGECETCCVCDNSTSNGLTFTFEGEEFTADIVGGFWVASKTSGLSNWLVSYGAVTPNEFGFLYYETRPSPCEQDLLVERSIFVGCVDGKWTAQLNSNCRVCDPEPPCGECELRGRTWLAEFQCDEDGAPIGGPVNLTQSGSDSGTADCDPPPASISFGNPLP